MPCPLPRRTRTGARVGCFPVCTAFPETQAGRRPRLHFRGLLRLHSRYGLSDCSIARGDLCHEASARWVAPPNRSSATSATDNSLGGTFLHWQTAPSGRTEFFRLGGLDGFDEDEAEGEGHNGAVGLGGLLATQRQALEARPSLPTPKALQVIARARDVSHPRTRDLLRSVIEKVRSDKRFARLDTPEAVAVVPIMPRDDQGISSRSQCRRPASDLLP